MIKLIATAALCLSVASLHAQTPAPLLLEPAALNLNEPGLVILQTGTEANFAAAHIPGSRYYALANYATPTTGPAATSSATPSTAGDENLSAELLDVAVLRKNLEGAGVSDSSHIVVLFDTAANLTQATRLVFTLDHLNLGDRTSFLNGGLPGWQGAGKPVTKEVAASVAPGHLKVQDPKQNVVGHYFVQRMFGHDNLRLVDARAPEFYNGDRESYGQRGHIPGAVAIPFSDFLDADGKVNLPKIKQDFTVNAIAPGDTVVAYCHIGMQATVDALAARLLGHSAIVYDGSFQDWATHNYGPVEK